MDGDVLLSIGGILGGAAAIGTLLREVWQYRAGDGDRRARAEAAKASLDVAQAEASLPMVQESLRIGNVAQAVTLQQQVMNGLREHMAWQDEQMLAKDQRIEFLENRDEQRVKRIDQLETHLQTLEKQLRSVEEQLAVARGIIDDLRGSRAAEG